MPRSDLLARAVVAVAAPAALLLDAPAPVAGGLALLALVLAGERLVRLRDTDALDRTLVLVGGLVVALVLTGMLLGITGTTLDERSWVVALSVLAGLGLLLAARRPAVRREADGWPGALSLAPWLVVVALVVGGAVTVSVRSLDAVQVAPLQMAFGTVAGTRVPVVVSAGARTGPLELRASSAGGDDVSYPLFTVPAGGSVTTTVELPPTGRFLITLNNPDQTQPLRTIVLDR